jgi:hypothetical protein
MNLPSLLFLLLLLAPDSRGGGRPKIFLRVLGRGRAVFERVGGLGCCRIDMRTLHSHFFHALVLWPLERWRQGTTRPERPRDARRRAGSGVSLLIGGTSILQSINIMSARADGTDGPRGVKQSTEMQRPGKPALQSRALTGSAPADAKSCITSSAADTRCFLEAGRAFPFSALWSHASSPDDGGFTARTHAAPRTAAADMGTGPS